MVIDTYSGSQRHFWHDQHYSPQTIQSYPFIHLFYVSDFPFPSHIPILLLPQENYLNPSVYKFNSHKNAQILMKLNFTLHYFYYQTKDNWFFRAEDDGGVYLDNLVKALTFLNLKYHSNDEAKLFGLNIYESLLGGGCGYIFSRKAAKVWLDNAEILLSDVKDNFDYESAKWLKLFNSTFNEAFSIPFSSGFISPFNIYYHDVFLNRNPQVNLTSYLKIKHSTFLKTLPLCNNSLPSFKVKDIFSYHHFWDISMNKSTYDTQYEDLIKTAPVQLHYQDCSWECHPCKQFWLNSNY